MPKVERPIIVLPSSVPRGECGAPESPVHDRSGAGLRGVSATVPSACSLPVRISLGDTREHPGRCATMRPTAPLEAPRRATCIPRAAVCTPADFDVR